MSETEKYFLSVDWNSVRLLLSDCFFLDLVDMPARPALCDASRPVDDIAMNEMKECQETETRYRKDVTVATQRCEFSHSLENFCWD